MIADINITVGEVIVYIIAGLVIGAIARLLVPGRQEMSVVVTIILGVIAAVVGGIAWEAIFGEDNDGVAWIGSIIVAIVLILLYGMMSGRGRSRPAP